MSKKSEQNQALTMQAASKPGMRWYGEFELLALSALELDLIALDHRIREELAAHLLERGAGALAIGLGEVEVDHFALAHRVDAVKAERAQRVRDRLALRIEHAVLEHDMDARLHSAALIGRFACP